MTTIEMAARNNAAWCDAVCRAHGLAGSFHPTVWVNAGPVPPLYPNLVTLTADDSALQLAEVERLAAAAPDRDLAVKDSFARLDLHGLGFNPLFEAMWFARPPASVEPARHGTHPPWQRLDREELTAWEAAWRSAGGLTDISQYPIFPAPLLDHPGVGLWACQSGSSIIAGTIAFRSPGAIGLTNFFAPAGEEAPQLAGCIAALGTAHAIVGYVSPAFVTRHAALDLHL